MTKTDIIRKLTSRKLWLAVALFVSGLIVAFGGSDAVAATVSGCIMQGAAVLGYLLAEGLADAAARKTQSTAAQEPVAQLPIGDTESTYDPVDAGTTNYVHPPDEATAKVGFEY